MIPKNEQGVIVIFAQRCESMGWKISSVGTIFPDAVICSIEGEMYNAEFEHRASNFKAHRHDLRECDLIICWENDWPDCPITIWEMKNWTDTEIIIPDPRDVEIANLQVENQYLASRVNILKKKLEIAENKPDATTLFHCEYCENVFATQQALNAHQRAHRGNDQRVKTKEKVN